MPSQLRSKQWCSHNRHSSRGCVVDLLRNAGGKPGGRDEYASRIVQVADVGQVAGDPDCRRGQPAQPAHAFGCVDAGNCEWNRIAQLRLNSRKDFFEKPYDRVAVRSRVFANRADEQKSFAFAEPARAGTRCDRMSQDVNGVDPVFLKFVSFGF